jgi:hypothetical protein
MKNLNLYKKNRVQKVRRNKYEDMSVVNALQLIFFHPHTRANHNLGLL